MGQTKTFNVAGVTYKNRPKDKLTRLEMISRYCSYPSTFKLEREPDNKFDSNAIKVKQVFKSGNSITIGYVPNRSGKKLADEIGPLMDQFDWQPVVKFGRKFINEDTGECQGLQLRYETR
jgi:hypothetical protein